MICENVCSMCSEVQLVTFPLDHISFFFSLKINPRQQYEALSPDFSKSSRFLKHDLLLSHVLIELQVDC